jgi:hypothetical protein
MSGGDNGMKWWQRKDNSVGSLRCDVDHSAAMPEINARLPPVGYTLAHDIRWRQDLFLLTTYLIHAQKIVRESSLRRH